MTPSHAELQLTPDSATLSKIADSIVPGSTVESVRRLTGGLDNGMHVLELSGPGDMPRSVVLRRFGGQWDSASAKATREWKTLRLLDRLGVPVPSPMALDADGEIAGSPAIVISFEDGRPVLRTNEVERWVEQVAGVSHRLHSASVTVEETAFLGPVSSMAEIVERQVGDSRRFDEHPLGGRLRDAIIGYAVMAKDTGVSLLHDDFWPGNILWRDGRLLAIVDWCDARVGYPALDVGYMWMDLAIVGEEDAAGEFVETYQRMRGAPLENLRLGQLLALSRAAPDPARWMPSWVGSGRDDLDVEDVRANLSAAIMRLTG